MTDNGAGYRSSIQPAAPGSGAEPDPAIIPLFGEGGPDQLEKGLVKVITGGAGWVAPDKESPLAIVRGTGEGAKAEIVRPGQILRIVPGIGQPPSPSLVSSARSKNPQTFQTMKTNPRWGSQNGRKADCGAGSGSRTSGTTSTISTATICRQLGSWRCWTGHETRISGPRIYGPTPTA
jgi:hypothetical protein